MGPFIGLSLLILVAYGIFRNSGERKHGLTNWNNTNSKKKKYIKGRGDI